LSSLFFSLSRAGALSLTQHNNNNNNNTHACIGTHDILAHARSADDSGGWLGSNEPTTGSAALESVRSEFTLSDTRLRTLIENFLMEMSLGLEGKASSIKMIPSHVSSVPTGKESGSAWAIDLGGSNLRVLKVGLVQGKEVRGRGSVPDIIKKAPPPPTHPPTHTHTHTHTHFRQ